MTDPSYPIRPRDVHTPDFTKHAPPATIAQNIYENIQHNEVMPPKMDPTSSARRDRGDRPASGAKIYVASKVLHAPMWRDLRATGTAIVSTWIDEAGEGETKDYAEFWVRIRDEIRSATALLFLVQPGEDRSGGTLVEVGIAVGFDKRVVLVGNPKKGTWPNIPNVVRAGTLREGLVACGAHAPMFFPGQW